MLSRYRYYQTEADQAIYDELQNADKCLVKMFCGTGKSLVMRQCKIIQDKSLVVYVFPSLSLITQFHNTYLFNIPQNHKLNISSDVANNSTTDATVIQSFIAQANNKYICVTYQSFDVLLDNLCGTHIDVCIFDEAHHAVGQTYQKLIFDNHCCHKQIFFTATPKNTNGIVMYDRHNLDTNMCGKLVYEYSYLKGVYEHYLTPFEIRIDLFTENTNRSQFESIARAILASGNNRVLTFHADVNTDRDTSVLSFVDQSAFIRAFESVRLKEFPNSRFQEKHVKMIALDSSISTKTRTELLQQFDHTPDNHIIVISSCETIGEGIDTKNANMCVFVDPKSSYVKIIQNIGRIVRKNKNPMSTILIPCWVDRDKYIDCNGDREKCDEVIRQDMAVGGNFNGILNVMSALRQEDEDIYDICLYYPDTFSPQEIIGNLERQGFSANDVVGEGGVIETCEHLLDQPLDCDDYQDCETDEDLLLAIADNNDVCIEVHTNSLENPVEKYNPDAPNVIRLYKNSEQLYENDDDTPVYQPIVQKDGEQKRTDKSHQIQAPNRNHRTNINVHANPDIKVLWKLSGDITKNVCSCVMDCEVVDTWNEKYEKCKLFVDTNQRFPRDCSKDKTEKRLGQWFHHQQKNYKIKSAGMKDKTRYNLWTQFLETYKYCIKDFDKIWMNRYEECKLFAETNQRFPSQTSENGIWFNQQQIYFNKKSGGMKDETRYNLWLQLLETYKHCLKDNNKIWMNKYEECKLFVETNQRFPSNSSKNNTEKKIGSWFTSQQQKYKNNSDGMKDEKRYNLWTQLLETHKDCLNDFDVIWMNKYKECKLFAETNQRFPSQHANNDTEKKLANWVSHQQKYYKNKSYGMKDETRYNLWTQLLDTYKIYLKDYDDIWINKYKECKLFANIYQRFPLATEIYNGNKIGQWFHAQQKHYKNKSGGMKDEKRYNLWTQLLETYKHLLNKRNKKDNNSTPSLQEDIQQPKENNEEPEEIIITVKKKKSMSLATSSNKEKNLSERQIKNKERVKSQLSSLHQKYKTLTSTNLHRMFEEDTHLWHTYHQISEQNEESFPVDEIPRNRIIRELDKYKTNRKKVVVDMGCGKAHIAEHFKGDPRFTFHNYDHVSANDNVEVCDISRLPLEDNSAEICILSLAMWGHNCGDYIKEAYRVLESNCVLYIIEPTKRWSEKDDVGNIVKGMECVRLKNELLANHFEIDKEYIDKFSLLICKKP